MKQYFLILILLFAGCDSVVSPGATQAAIEQARAAAAAVIPLTLAVVPPQPGPQPGPSPIPPAPNKEVDELRRALKAEQAQVERVQSEWKADRERLDTLLKRLEKIELEKTFPVVPPAAVPPVTEPKGVNATVERPPMADSVNWGSDWQAAKEEATATGKPVLLWFTMQNCPWCDRVEAQCFSDPEVARYINENTVPLLIHKEKQTREILAKWNVDSYPAFRAIRSDYSGWTTVDNTMQPREWLTNLDKLVAWNIKPQTTRISSGNDYYQPYYDDAVYVEQSCATDDITYVGTSYDDGEYMVCGPEGCTTSTGYYDSYPSMGYQRMSYPRMGYGSRGYSRGYGGRTYGGGFFGGGWGFGGGGGCVGCQ